MLNTPLSLSLITSSNPLPVDTPSNRNITEVLEELRKTDGNARAAIFQNVIAHMIPKLSEDRKLCDLTECVLDSNRDVQEVAIAWLETTMLKLQYR